VKGSANVFVTDLVDEGHDAVLDNLQERGGLDGITVACNYHHSRDVFPHNPRHRVIYFTGEHFFEPDRRRYGRIQPVVSPLAERDPLRVLVTRARQRGMAVRGWVNFLHNSRLGQRYPECTVANAFGDRYPNALCPANPDCRAYVRAFGSDLGTYGLEAIRAESVGYMPFEHGYHHERCFVPLSPLARFLMGVCFCDHCIAAARTAGVDGEAVRKFVEAELGRALGGDPGPLDAVPLAREAIGALMAGEVAGYLATRERTVTSLVGEATEAIHAAGRAGAHDGGRSDFVVVEWSGGLRAPSSGMTVAGSQGAALDRAWQDGIALDAVLGACDGVSVLGYVGDRARLAADLEAYAPRIPAGRSLSVSLRPMLPDCGSAEELRARTALVAAFGPRWIEFYHYGFVPLERLDWIRSALEAARETVASERGAPPGRPTGGTRP
jgi:hypothetical protein